MTKQLQKTLITDISKISQKILSINIRNGKCTAHLYHFERQGDSEKSRYIYRCTRAGCHHYSTLTSIPGRIAQCRNCGNTFTVDPILHIIKSHAGDIEKMFHEFPVCCDVTDREVAIEEVQSLDFMEEC